MVHNFLEMFGARGVPLDVFLRDAPIMAHSIDEHGNLLNVSEFWAHRLGYRASEMIGQSSIDFLAPSSKVYAATEVLPKFWREGRITNVRYKFLHKDQTRIIPVIMNAIAVKGDGQIRSLAVMFDNGISARIEEIENTLELASKTLDALAAKSEPDMAEEIETIANALRQTLTD